MASAPPEDERLAEGLVVGTVSEPPFHHGPFDIATGKALSPPVCVDLKTYPVKVEDGAVLVRLG